MSSKTTISKETAVLKENNIPRISFKLENFGCQMNVTDANEIRNILLKKKFIEQKEIADVVIINSCAIRHTSENRTYARLQHYASQKRHYPFILVLSGCVAQKEKEKIIERIPAVNLVIGTHEKWLLADIVESYIKDNPLKIDSTKNHNFNIKFPHGKSYESKSKTCGEERKSFIFDNLQIYQFTPSLPSKRYPFKSDIIIIHGCNKFCSYCIVPFTRGIEMSQKSSNIIESAKKLAGKGVTEICLLGQNVNSYGQDLDNEISFSKLLYKLNTVDGIKRIRFLTSHPMDFSEDLIDAIADNEKVCNYIHLPIQTASNKVLKDMRRNYTYEKYMRIIEKMREKVKPLTLTTDILVGFCGETKEEFQETLQAVKSIRYDQSFMFKYSVREGSEAERLEDSVSPEEKQERLQAIINAQLQITKEKNKEKLGTIREVLFEGYSKKDKDFILGKTEGNESVIIHSKNAKIGTYKKVKLDSLNGNTFIGLEID